MTRVETGADRASAEAPATEVGLPALGRIGGRFAIEQRLGLGGMGSVYLAYDHEEGRRVALKIVHAGHPSLDARFEREARTLEGLDHPGIVRHLAHGITSDGTWFLATEVLAGCTLRERLREGVLAVREALSIAISLAEVLAFLHGQGLVHRDLTPSNVFLCDDGSVRLIDFGLSGFAGGSHTLTGPGGVVGTVGYLSPEQGRGAEVDGRSDVFSLGCLLVAMLTGRPPFGGALAELLAQLERDDDPTRTLPASTPLQVREAIRAMLARDPAMRTASALIATRGLIHSLAPSAPTGTAPEADALFSATLASSGPSGSQAGVVTTTFAERELLDPLWSSDDVHAAALRSTSEAERWGEPQLVRALLAAPARIILIDGFLELDLDEGQRLVTLAAASRALLDDEPALSRAAAVAAHGAEDRRALALLCPRLVQEVEAIAARAGVELASVERVLLEQRAYSRVLLLGERMLRGRLAVGGLERALPCYLPEAAAARLPLCRGFRARLVAELRPDQADRLAAVVSLRALALGRVVRPASF